MKQLFLVILTGLIFIGCDKNHKEFTLKTIKLNSYKSINLPAQNLSFRIVQGINTQTPLAATDTYPTKLPLPVTLAVTPSLSAKLYSQSYSIQLLGDSTGLIGSCTVDMDQYKIIFPIEMEIENEEMNISISGSWH
jgi:hypothetical protein